MSTSTPPPSEPSIPDLIKSAAYDVSTLVSDQIEITKLELKASATSAGRAFGLLAAAAFVAIFLLLFLLLTIALGISALGLPLWAGFGIVTLGLLLITLVLVLVGKKQAEKVQAPQRTMAQLEAGQEAVAKVLDPIKPKPQHQNRAA